MNELKISGLVKSYGDNTILNGLDLTVKKGEVVVILGPSGCGKSTLLRCINGLETVNAGEITLDGVRISDHPKELPRIRQRIGMVFQSYDLFPHKTILDNITLAPMKVQKRNRKEVEAEAETLLKRVGLLEKKDAYPRAAVRAVRSSGLPLSAPCACIRRSCCLTRSPPRWIRKWCGRYWTLCWSWLSRG